MIVIKSGISNLVHTTHFWNNLRITSSDYSFGIFKLFLLEFYIVVVLAVDNVFYSFNTHFCKILAMTTFSSFNAKC